MAVPCCFTALNWLNIFEENANQRYFITGDNLKRAIFCRAPISVIGKKLPLHDTSWTKQRMYPFACFGMNKKAKIERGGIPADIEKITPSEKVPSNTALKPL
jgi:hypothetical protein